MKKIVILNGAGKKNGNTAAMIDAFRAGAAGNEVTEFYLQTMNIHGCLDCGGCRRKEKGSPEPCVQKDDMQEIYPKLAEADCVVFTSPVYYWSFSGQMQSLITRFYAPGKPAAKKYAMILSSGSPGVYEAPISQYKSILSYFGAEDLGIFVFNGPDQTTEDNLAEIKAFAASI